MEMHQIRYFLAVVDQGSITQAAEACHVSQPSLSQQLAKLEDELGGPLFVRGRGGSRLTDRAALFLPRAREIVYQARSVADDMQAYAGLARGRVRLGCMPGTGAYVLPPLLRAWQEAHPGVTVELLEETSPDLALALSEGRVDLALVDETAQGPGLDVAVLFSEPLLLALPLDHPWTREEKGLALKDLADQPLILMKPGHGFRRIVLRALASAGVEPRVVYETSSIETVQALVEAGLGLSLVPRLVTRGTHRRDGLTYRDLRDPDARRTILVASRSGAPDVPAVQALKTLARGVFSQDRSWGQDTPGLCDRGLEG